MKNRRETSRHAANISEIICGCAAMLKKMENSYRFFNNRSCKYFPCHEMSSQCDFDYEDFNCLFCYCPLYSFGDNCGGNFTYNKEKTLKLCMDCGLPHLPEHYDVIVKKLSETNS